MLCVVNLLRSTPSRRLQRQPRLLVSYKGNAYCSLRHVSTLPPQKEQSDRQRGAEHEDGSHVNNEEIGGMSRRLAQMTDENLQDGGLGAAKAVAEAGFSDELRRQLEERMLNSKFKSENHAAFAQLDMPSSAGQGTRQVAAAQPWTGNERVEDAALRMLTDVHKPLRGTGPAKIPTPTGPSLSVDMRMRKAAQKSQGQRLANARDRTSVYALSQDPNLSDYEKEQMRKQLKDRFTPGARPVPGTVQGLAALANERIEDAIARGQFKNITRGKGKNIERDYTASSPFLDTTEYFMNKIIQKQEIVPPWIEKQQELVKAAAVFRSRLRADWKRHAARMIASRGGSLEAQIAQAKAFAAAEEINNAKPSRSEAISEIDMEGRISQVPITPDIASLSNMQITDNPAAESTSLESNMSSSVSNMNSQTISEQTLDSPMSLKSLLPPSTTSSTEPNPLSTHPFRDPSWEALEHKYHTLAITSLNNLTRSYNLQAPTLAKKPYFSLARELAACYADTAPLIPGEILARASAPKQKPEASSTRKGGLLDKLGGGSVRVVESRAPHYGFRQFWKDVWGGAGERS